MDNSTFLQYYQLLQYSIMGDRLVSLGFASITYNNGSPSSFWNHAFTANVLNNNNLAVIENTLKELDRKPAVYFENSKRLSKNRNLLSNSKYKQDWEDSWMFHSGQGIDETGFRSVKKVESPKNLKVFLRTFDACYQNDDPQNPYGELGEYLDVTKEVWARHYANARLEYFVIVDGDQPVAISTLTNFAGIGYISNVGSLKSVRGKGFGKVASLYCVYKSIENGNNLHCLATEEGNYPNAFYKRIGFKTKFTAVGWVRN